MYHLKPNSILTITEYFTATSHTQIVEYDEGEFLHVPYICIKMFDEDT